MPHGGGRLGALRGIMSGSGGDHVVKRLVFAVGDTPVSFHHAAARPSLRATPRPLPNSFSRSPVAEQSHSRTAVAASSHLRPGRYGLLSDGEELGILCVVCQRPGQAVSLPRWSCLTAFPRLSPQMDLRLPAPVAADTHAPCPTGHPPATMSCPRTARRSAAAPGQPPWSSPAPQRSSCASLRTSAARPSWCVLGHVQLLVRARSSIMGPRPLTSPCGATVQAQQQGKQVLWQVQVTEIEQRLAQQLSIVASRISKKEVLYAAGEGAGTRRERDAITQGAVGGVHATACHACMCVAACMSHARRVHPASRLKRICISRRACRTCTVCLMHAPRAERPAA